MCTALAARNHPMHLGTACALLAPAAKGSFPPLKDSEVDMGGARGTGGSWVKRAIGNRERETQEAKVLFEASFILYIAEQ